MLIATLGVNEYVEGPSGMRSLIWVVSVLAGLGFLMFGLSRMRPALTALADDESTLSNRTAALAAGFWAAISAALIGLIVVMYVNSIASEAMIRIVVSVGAGGALLRFGALERKALAE